MAKERFFIGLYSGPVADGVDAAMIRVTGHSERMKVRQLHQSHHAFTPELQRRIIEAGGDKPMTFAQFGQLEQEVTAVFADAALALMKNAGTKQQDVQAIGLSGARLWQGPRDAREKNSMPIVVDAGSPAILSAKTGIAVASGFAQCDIAVGGIGGPVTAWADWAMFRHKRLSRVLMHLGGLTSLTFLGSDAHPVDVVAYDVGPGMILINAITEEFYGRPMDVDGGFAARGSVSSPLLNELMSNPYFRQPTPKLSDRQQWGPVYLSRLRMMAQRHRCKDEDVVATVTEMIARSVAAAVSNLTERPHEVILSGGGAKNIFLAGRIRSMCSPSSTINSEKLGYSVTAKQAAAFGVLAAARLDEASIYCPFATGAKQPSVLGAFWP